MQDGKFLQKLNASTLSSQYGWEPLAEAHTSLEDGRLTRTESFHGDITQGLRRHGALLPKHVPIVCPSFASNDLRDPDNDSNRKGHDKHSGRDPWSILDYIRDALMWPSDAIFIDAECFGAPA